MPISPAYIPEELHYIIPLAERHGTDARVADFDPSLGRHVEYGETLSAEEIEPLRNLYEEIRSKSHGPLINRWHWENEKKNNCPPETTWPIYGLLCLFAQFARLDIAPFNDCSITPEVRKLTSIELDWGKLPSKLRYLAGPAEVYGSLQFDDPIYEFLQERMTAEEREELRNLNKRYCADGESIDRWLNRFRITDHEEASLVYFLGHLLATGVDLDLL